MSFREQVSRYVREIRRRLRLETTARGLGLCGVVALGATLLAVLGANFWRFSETAVLVSTVGLWVALLAAVGYFLAWPLLRRLDDRRVARYVEEQHPELRERLSTAVDLSNKPVDEETTRLFGELVAEDAVNRSAPYPASELVEGQRIVKPLLWAAGSVAMILLLGFYGPGIFRYGVNALWVGWAQADTTPLYQLHVTPGDLTVGRNSDQEITAQPEGYIPRSIRLFALHEGSADWEAVPMLPQQEGGGYHFLFLGIQDPIQYYVDADGVRSPQYQISVIDIPRVERMEVRYEYPAYTRMDVSVDENGGDVIALKGTNITLTAHSDVDSPGGRMVLDDGSEIQLVKVGERQFQAAWTMEKDALYHIRLEDHLRREARASEEFLIQALDDSPPTIRLARPGRDLDPTPVEEVVIGFSAQDDVRVAELEMHYSVNGSPEQTVVLTSDNRTQEAAGNHRLQLEDYNMVPGDLVSYYGVAKDGTGVSEQTEMYFLQVRPFERNYTQGQAGGGGGGGMGGENTFLSEKQKEIIAATWNVVRNQERQSPDQLREAGEVLSEVQRGLKEQAETLASRVSRRQLSGVNEEFAGLVENLRKAVEAMEPAANELDRQEFQQALSPEQTALQFLLRAEALFRDIQVAFNNGGGGGGGGGSAGRDLSDLFALELDTNKNQYETLQQMSSNQNNAELTEAQRKLEELARRQENLARQNRDQRDSMRSASRWEQEQLRREAEELARQLERLSRQMNSPQLGQASRMVSQAGRDMQQANGQGQQGGSESTRASNRLREAGEMLSGQQNQMDQQAMERLKERAEDLAAQQQQIADDVRTMARGGERPRNDPAARQALGEVFDKKRALLDGLRNMEQQLSQTAGRMADNQRRTAQQLREASSSIQEERLGDKIRQGAWLEQQGLWPTAAPVEDDLSADFDRLAERVRNAEQALGERSTGDRLREALTAAERVRQGLERMDRGMQPGSQPGQQGQEGQAGQQGGNQPGSQMAGGQPGGNQPGGVAGPGGPRNGFQGGQGGLYGDARNFGGLNPNMQPLTEEERRALAQQYAQLAQEASDLRGLLADEQELLRMAQQLTRAMQGLDPRAIPGPRELETLRSELVEQWKELELRLRRQLQMDQPEAARVASQERVPERYRSMVEEYYRSISRGDRQGEE